MSLKETSFEGERQTEENGFQQLGRGGLLR